MEQLPISTDFHPGLPSEYPAPPRVKWWVLWASWAVISILIGDFLKGPYQELFQSLVVDAWAFYLCRWIGKLGPGMRAPFWGDCAIVVELIYAALKSHQNPSSQFDVILTVLGIASFILYLIALYAIRSDLQKHYNAVEPFGLQLGPYMTFFFSFLYFQYHLYDIAEQKQREQRESAAGYFGPPS